MEKKCTKCQEVKPLDQFYKDKYNKKDGHMYTCKTCDNKYQKAWREKQKALKATEVAVAYEI